MFDNFVSIVIPYYNASQYIMETVESIIAQTYTNWELIIVDDCSTWHDTKSVLDKVQQMDRRIMVLHTTHNGGAGRARNVGIEAAKGRYIAFCDSDDWWYPTKLEEQLRFMQSHGYEFTCTYYEDVYENLTPYYIMKQPMRQSMRDLIVGCNIGTPGVIYDTKRIGKHYFPPLRKAEDWGAWIGILKSVNYIYTYVKPMWKYRHVPGSETSNKLRMFKPVVDMYQMVLGYGKCRAWATCIFIFLPKNVWKKIKKYL